MRYEAASIRYGLLVAEEAAHVAYALLAVVIAAGAEPARDRKKESTTMRMMVDRKYSN